GSGDVYSALQGHPGDVAREVGEVTHRSAGRLARAAPAARRAKTYLGQYRPDTGGLPCAAAEEAAVRRLPSSLPLPSPFAVAVPQRPTPNAQHRQTDTFSE